MEWLDLSSNTTIEGLPTKKRRIELIKSQTIIQPRTDIINLDRSKKVSRRNERNAKNCNLTAFECVCRID